MINLDILTLAKELGSAIQMDDAYINFKIAEQNMQCDTDLQKNISEFNEKKSEINQEIASEKINQEKVDKLNIRIGELYVAINESDTMKAHNKLKNNLQNLLTKINIIVSKSAQGQDPNSIDLDEATMAQGCAGSCSSCTGCG